MDTDDEDIVSGFFCQVVAGVCFFFTLKVKQMSSSENVSSSADAAVAPPAGLEEKRERRAVRLLRGQQLTGAVVANEDSRLTDCGELVRSASLQIQCEQQFLKIPPLTAHR